MLYIYAHTCDFIQNSHTLQSNNFTPRYIVPRFECFQKQIRRLRFQCKYFICEMITENASREVRHGEVSCERLWAPGAPSD